MILVYTKTCFSWIKNVNNTYHCGSHSMVRGRQILESSIIAQHIVLYGLFHSQYRWLQLKLWILMWVRLAWTHRTIALTRVMALPLATLKDQTWMQRECSLLWYVHEFWSHLHSNISDSGGLCSEGQTSSCQAFFFCLFAWGGIGLNLYIHLRNYALLCSCLICSWLLEKRRIWTFSSLCAILLWSTNSRISETRSGTYSSYYPLVSLMILTELAQKFGY